MNGTFMFGEDRFSEQEDFSAYYKSIGGGLDGDRVNSLIRQAYEFLDERYPDERFRNCFPTLHEAIANCSKTNLSDTEKQKIVETFSYHEHGDIAEEYISALKRLKERFTLSLVVDIWAPKEMWVSTFKRLGIWRHFSAHSFSSDHGCVKPSAKPFEMVLQQLAISKEKCLVVGDSIRRDLGGAKAAGIDCVLVGGARSSDALACYGDLLEFDEAVNSCNR